MLSVKEINTLENYQNHKGFYPGKEEKLKKKGFMRTNETNYQEERRRRFSGNTARETDWTNLTEIAKTFV